MNASYTFTIHIQQRNHAAKNKECYTSKQILRILHNSSVDIFCITTNLEILDPERLLFEYEGTSSERAGQVHISKSSGQGHGSTKPQNVTGPLFIIKANLVIAKFGPDKPFTHL